VFSGRELVAVEQQAQPAAGVVAAVNVDDVGTVRLLVGEHDDRGGVDIGDRPAVGVLDELDGDAGEGHVASSSAPLGRERG
jgi:hypothetical protein